MADLKQTGSISELVAGYDTYSEAGELVAEAAADAPASTPTCAAATISWLGSQLTVKTYKEGC